jgi:hypothetical protein
LKDEGAIQYGAATYRGVLYTEHGQDDSTEQKMDRSWASLDNPVSFWFTRPSLLNLLRDAGFSSVFEILRPQGLGAEDYSDRLAFAAVKGEIQKSPYWGSADERDVPEVSLLLPYPPPAGANDYATLEMDCEGNKASNNLLALRNDRAVPDFRKNLSAQGEI